MLIVTCPAAAQYLIFPAIVPCKVLPVFTSWKPTYPDALNRSCASHDCTSACKMAWKPNKNYFSFSKFETCLSLVAPFFYGSQTRRYQAPVLWMCFAVCCWHLIKSAYALFLFPHWKQFIWSLFNYIIETWFGCIPEPVSGPSGNFSGPWRDVSGVGQFVIHTPYILHFPCVKAELYGIVLWQWPTLDVCPCCIRSLSHQPKRLQEI